MLRIADKVQKLNNIQVEDVFLTESFKSSILRDFMEVMKKDIYNNTVRKDIRGMNNDLYDRSPLPTGIAWDEITDEEIAFFDACLDPESGDYKKLKKYTGSEDYIIIWYTLFDAKKPSLDSRGHTDLILPPGVCFITNKNVEILNQAYRDKYFRTSFKGIEKDTERLEKACRMYREINHHNICNYEVMTGVNNLRKDRNYDAWLSYNNSKKIIDKPLVATEKILQFYTNSGMYFDTAKHAGIPSERDNGQSPLYISTDLMIPAGKKSYKIAMPSSYRSYKISVKDFVDGIVPAAAIVLSREVIAKHSTAQKIMDRVNSRVGAVALMRDVKKASDNVTSYGRDYVYDYSLIKQSNLARYRKTIDYVSDMGAIDLSNYINTTVKPVLDKINNTIDSASKNKFAPAEWGDADKVTSKEFVQRYFTNRRAIQSTEVATLIVELRADYDLILSYIISLSQAKNGGENTSNIKSMQDKLTNVILKSATERVNNLTKILSQQ